MVKLKTNLPKIKKKDAKVSKTPKVKKALGKKNKAPKPTRKKVTKKSTVKVTSSSISTLFMKDVKSAKGKKLASYKVDRSVAASVTSYLSVMATNILVKEYSVAAIRSKLTSNLDTILKSATTKALAGNSSIYETIQSTVAEKIKGKVAAVINKTQRGVAKEAISAADLKSAVADIQAVISPVAAPKKKPSTKKDTTKKKTKRPKRGK